MRRAPEGGSRKPSDLVMVSLRRSGTLWGVEGLKLTHCHASHVPEGIGLWRIDLPTSEGLGKSFIAAILLTADMKRAECAVLRSISLLDGGCASDGCLLRGTVKASLAGAIGITEQVPEELAEGCSMLPLELQRVLHLSRDFRQCFVLRILLGLSREVCASLLGLDVEGIDERTCASVLQLAMTQDRQRSRLQASHYDAASNYPPNAMILIPLPVDEQM